MPRINFKHPAIDAWYKRHEEGTSTFDVCNRCLRHNDTADALNLINAGYNGDPIPADAYVEITGNNPPYEDGEYHCCICGALLTSDDNDIN